MSKRRTARTPSVAEDKRAARDASLKRHGYKFKSVSEADFADELETRLINGEIAGWTYEATRFALEVNGVHVCRYTPDFCVNHLDGTDEWIEYKGFWRPDAKLRVKLFKAVHPELKFTVAGTPMDKRRKSK